MAFVMLYTQTSFILSQMPCFVSSWSLKITQNDCRILYGLKVLEFSKPFCEYSTLRSFLFFFFGHSEFCSKYPVELFLEGKILGMTSQGQRPWASSWLLLYFCRLCLRDVDFSEEGNAVLELVLSAERGRCWELGTCWFRLFCFPFLSQNA